MSKTTDPIALREWIVIGAITDVPQGVPYRTRLLGQEIVCLRHGDAFQVHEVDGDLTSQRQVQVRTRYGHVWVCLSDEARPMIEVAEFVDPRRRMITWGGVYVRTSPQRLVENFLDMGHFPFVHTGILGAEPVTEIRDYKVEVRAEDAEVWATECMFYQPRASMAADAGRDTAYIYRTSGPFVAVLYKTAEEEGAVDNIGMLVQPLDEEHCRVFGYTLLLEEDTSDTEALHFQQTVFLQDRLILEQQTPRRIPLYEKNEIPARADAASVGYRRWLRAVGMQFGVLPQQVKEGSLQ
ncbi:aromatic ring-hydroxylating dioxygenase subunit alpha [Herbaspirillum sp. RV1423]|uniref:aromatic ring-hydroxylating oxygenase subunit alpha n=1 Tax=Herbaspirillum sp. RV1423 TaxID=1443993 RepID=UPI0004B0E560|nr:aromatic ring-hydroxylating dioxygenase subunit alpha [Herbaspirillum sp. RV1423]